MADDIVKVPEGVDGDITEVKEVALTEESIVEETVNENVKETVEETGEETVTKTEEEIVIKDVDESGVKAPKKKEKKTTIGGQALIEGIMMCGPTTTSMAVRKGDGTIYVEEVKQSERTSYFEKVPFIRGCIKFYKMLVTGTSAIMKSADISEQGKPENENTNDADKKSSRLDDYLEKHSDVAVTVSAIVGILLSIGLFILLPRVIVAAISYFLSEELLSKLWMSVVLNAVEGVLRMVIFLVYLALVSKLPDIARVWMYHGAEHKTIACYEAREPLTVENIKKHSRLHPRCGTAFMFIVLLISILIYTVCGVLIGDRNVWVSLGIRLVLIPLICGISYEILRFVGRHAEKGICKVLCKPGLWLQKFTTREPDAAIIEVAIAAMQAVIPENDNADNW